MTIKDLWEKMLNADLIPIGQAIAEGLLWAISITAVLMIAVGLGVHWWVRKH